MIRNVFGVVLTIMNRKFNISLHPAITREINYEMFVCGGKETRINITPIKDKFLM